MKSLLGVLIAALMAVTVAVAPASAGDTEDVTINVMSQNMYIGADLSLVLNGSATPAEIFDTVKKSDIGGRSFQMAETIKENQPDLVGLQEVTLIEVLDADDNVLQVIDYLEILMGSLDILGESYAVSSFVENADVKLPIAPGIFVRVVDRDVIIHKTGTAVSNPHGAPFSTNFRFPLGGEWIQFTRGFTAVDATFGGTTFRFVNTHLEVEGIPCVTPGGLVICQNAQATELIDTLYTEGKPVILVGDFNSAPGEVAYQTVVDRGYKDTWNSDTETGFTCCQPELLNNPDSELSRRIDHIFTRRRAIKVNTAITTVLSDEDDSKTPPPGELWSSDHGAPIADLGLTIKTNVKPGDEFEAGDD